MSSLNRLLVLAVLLGVCSAAHSGYNYNVAPAVSHASFPSVVDRDGSRKSLYFYTDSNSNGQQVNSQPRYRVPQTAPNVKKELQVIFVKTPRNTAYENTLLNLAKEAVQTQTVVYVLSKEPDIEDLKRRFEEVRASSIRMPEVRFVKYRTEDEAVRATQEIQAQYDRLPGSSKTTSPGISGGSQGFAVGSSGLSGNSQTFGHGSSGSSNPAVTVASNNQQYGQTSGLPMSLLQYAGELLPGIPGSTKAIQAGAIPHLHFGSGSNGVVSFPPYANTEHTSSENHDDDLYTNSQPPFLPTGIDVVPGSSYLPPQRGYKH